MTSKSNVTYFSTANCKFIVAATCAFKLKEVALNCVLVKLGATYVAAKFVGKVSDDCEYKNPTYALADNPPTRDADPMAEPEPLTVMDIPPNFKPRVMPTM